MLRFSLPFCRTAVSLPFFLRLPHTLFVKGNCTTISHSVGYSVVKEHFGSDSLGVFIRSYSPAELFALYIGLLKNRRKINPHSKTFFLVDFSALTYQVAENYSFWVKYFLAYLKSGIKNSSRAAAREEAYKYLLLYKNIRHRIKQIMLFSYGVLEICFVPYALMLRGKWNYQFIFCLLLCIQMTAALG